MRLLPSEQEERIQEAIVRYAETGELVIGESCNCGSQTRHNNGGNYHEIIFLKRDNPWYHENHYVKYETTCELVEPAEWDRLKSVSETHKIIRDNADWL